LQALLQLKMTKLKLVQGKKDMNRIKLIILVILAIFRSSLTSVQVCFNIITLCLVPFIWQVPCLRLSITNFKNKDRNACFIGGAVFENPAYFNLAPCPCDLTGNVCDINCCCDTEVSIDFNGILSKSTSTIQDWIFLWKWFNLFFYFMV